MSFFLDKNIKNILVTISSPGVYCFIKKDTKTVWVSYSENMAEAVIRNLKKIKEKDHPIKSQEDCDIQILDLCKSKKEAKLSFSYHCANFKSNGCTLLNKTFRYTVRGRIGRDFRDNKGFLYYAVLRGQGRDLGVLGVFDSLRDWEAFIGQYNANSGVLGDASKYLRGNAVFLTEQYNKIDFSKEEFKRLMNNEAV